jgi:hypothetical protein
MSDVVAKDVVMQMYNLEPWGDPEHHAVTDADELVLEAVVGQERDDLAPLHRRLFPLASLPARLLEHLAMLLLAHLLASLLDE